ncbi:hypothetical protein L7F22_062049 [Adiantum nelumboides]|nr:hypothetical protein [Adiantum nelumboides]
MKETFEPLRVLGARRQGVVFHHKHKVLGALVVCKTSLSHNKYKPPFEELSTTLNIHVTRGKPLDLRLEAMCTKKKKPLNTKDQRSDDQFMRAEVRVMQCVGSHSNILPLLSTFESLDGFLHIVTPFCQHGSLLKKVLCNQQLQFGIAPQVDTSPLLLNACKVTKVIVGLARALSYCHALGIVHRDGKFDNIFVCNSHMKEGTAGYSVDWFDEEELTSSWLTLAMLSFFLTVRRSYHILQA